MSENLSDLMGCIGEDNLTGFQGLVFAKTDYMYGCSRYHVQPIKLKEDGSIGDIETFDVQRVMFVKKVGEKVKVVQPKIKLGSLAQDTLSGAEGIVSGITTYLYGEPPSILIEPKRCMLDGSPAKPLHFPEPRLKVVKEDKPKCERGSKLPGGPREKMYRHNDCL